MARRKRRKYPFMRFYTSDWIMSTRVLTDEEKAIWIDLLCFMWDNTKSRGSIEGYWYDLARVVGRDRFVFQNCVDSMRIKKVIEVDERVKNGHESYVKLSSSRILKDAKSLGMKHLRDKKYNDKRRQNDAPNDALNDAKTTPILHIAEVRSHIKTLGVVKDTTPIPPPASLQNGHKATKEPNDVHRIVNAWKLLTGYGLEDKPWDRLNFARCSGSAKKLLDFIGNWGDTVDCLQDVYEKLNSKGLTVTIETVVKHAADWKKDKSEREAKRGILPVQSF